MDGFHLVKFSPFFYKICDKYALPGLTPQFKNYKNTTSLNGF